MDSIAALKSISSKNGIDGSVAQAMEDVATLLEGGLADLESLLESSAAGGPPPVDDVCKHILDAGGKRIRPSICMLSSRAAGGTGALPVELSVACELLHNATLLHDDVIDEGDTRRGRPASRMVWSNALSILGGDYMLMRCVELVAKMGPQYMTRFVETLRLLVEGEVIQLKLRDSLDTTEEDYFKIVRGKTSSLFSFAAYTGALFSTDNESTCNNLGEFGKHIGVAFQLIDDALDFSTDSSLVGKNLLADIGQGKLTLPVILAAQNDSSVRTVLAELVGGGNTDALTCEISRLVSSTNSITMVKEKASEYTEKSLDALDRIQDGNPPIIETLRSLSLSLLSRTS